MKCYFVVPQSKTHALLLMRKLRGAGIPCELSPVPGPINTGVCNMAVKLTEINYKNSISIIKNAGLPGCRIYMETVNAGSSAYHEVNI